MYAELYRSSQNRNFFLESSALMWQQLESQSLMNLTYPLRCRIGSTVGSDPNSSIIPQLSGAAAITPHTTCICTRKSGNPSWCEALADPVDRLYKNGRLKSRYACAVYFHMLASVYMYTYIYGARIGSRLRAGEDATARRFHERRLFSLFLGLWWVHPSNWNDVKFPTWNVM